MRLKTISKSQKLSLLSLCLALVLISLKADEKKNRTRTKTLPPSEVFLEINAKEIKHLSEQFKSDFFQRASKLLPIQIEDKFPIKNILSYSWRSSLPEHSADKSISIARLKSETSIDQEAINNYFKEKLQGSYQISETSDSTKILFQSKMTENKDALTLVYPNESELLIGTPWLLNDWNHKTDQTIFKSFKKEKFFIFINITPSSLSKKYFEFLSELELKKGNLQLFNLFQLISDSAKIEIMTKVKENDFRISFAIKYDTNDGAETLTTLLYGFLRHSGVDASSENKEKILSIKKDVDKKTTYVEIQLTLDQVTKILRE